MRAEICPGPSIFVDRGTPDSMLKDSFNLKNGWPQGGGMIPFGGALVLKITLAIPVDIG